MPPVEIIVKFPKQVTIHNFLTQPIYSYTTLQTHRHNSCCSCSEPFNCPSKIFTVFGPSLLQKGTRHSNMVIDTKIPVMSCATYTLHV